MGALTGLCGTVSATWRGDGRAELGWQEEQGQPEPAKSCPCGGLGGRLLLSQQRGAGSGRAGEMEHVVLGESRGTT